MSPTLASKTDIVATMTRSSACAKNNNNTLIPLQSNGEAESFYETAENAFQLMLGRLEAAFSRRDNSVNTDDLWRILNSYKSNKDDWKKFAYYDGLKYKRNLVAEYENFNVMIICWPPGAKSSIHDHSGSHCFMKPKRKTPHANNTANAPIIKMLEGSLVETRFTWPDENQIIGALKQEMRIMSEEKLDENDIVYINGEFFLQRNT